VAAGTAQWWVIAITTYNGTTAGAATYVYFQGTQAQAQAKSKTYVETSSAPNLTGPYATKAAAQAAVAAKKVNTPGPVPGGEATSANGVTAACAWSFPAVSIPVVGQVPSFCLITKTEVRAFVAGLLMGAAGLIGLIGVSLLMVEGFQQSGAGSAAGRSLETVGAGIAFVPGLEGVGMATGAAGAATRRAGRSS
jgi:hypothetical protein